MISAPTSRKARESRSRETSAAATPKETLTFGWNFNQSLEEVSWPPGLQILTFGGEFNRPERLTWPSKLQSLTFGFRFNQSLLQVTLPDTLQSLTFGCAFDQSLDGVILPKGLRRLTFGDRFNQALEHVTWPESLERLGGKNRRPGPSTRDLLRIGP